MSKYTDLITSQHVDKPKFVDSIDAFTSAFIDLQNILDNIVQYRDLDTAIGQQLDDIGDWVGVTRGLEEEITGVFFSFGIVGQGFGEGIWKSASDPSTGIVKLPDDQYIIMLKTKIINNHWDGTQDGAYYIANTALSSIGAEIFMEDNCDLTFNLGFFTGGPPSKLTKILFLLGKYNVKPATVRIDKYIFQSAPGPIFAFGISNDRFGGFGEGSWASIKTP